MGTTFANRRVCIPTTQLKPDCNAYTFDAIFNVYNCIRCATAGNVLLPISLTPTTIDVCIKEPAVADCSLFANNPAEAICLQCSVGFFAAKDQAQKSICVPNVDSIQYCSNYQLVSPALPGSPALNAPQYTCVKCVAGIVPNVTVLPIRPECPVQPGNVIANCKNVNITGDTIKCI